jgi:hypothetical protein
MDIRFTSFRVRLSCEMYMGGVVQDMQDMQDILSTSLHVALM